MIFAVSMVPCPVTDTAASSVRAPTLVSCAKSMTAPAAVLAIFMLATEPPAIFRLIASAYTLTASKLPLRVTTSWAGTSSAIVTVSNPGPLRLASTSAAPVSRRTIFADVLPEATILTSFLPTVMFGRKQFSSATL
ncbi:MAG: hypothetical protein BWY65_02354 [Firmicutes bacterium ADurb.Bin373]|nr:MAG: hypothetical protein BWY65_02354 [Firmicutes bacterium ADurb.Bin373]